MSDRGQTVSFSYVRETVSVSYLRDQDMNQILMKKFFYIGLILLKSIHPVQDETEMRLSKIKEKETRPRKDCLKNCHPRQNRDKTSSRFLYKTESLGIFSLETRPRLSSFTERHSFDPIEVDI